MHLFDASKFLFKVYEESLSYDVHQKVLFIRTFKSFSYVKTELFKVALKNRKRFENFKNSAVTLHKK